MTPISAVGKFLDQPILTAKINKYVPFALAGAGSIVVEKTAKNVPKENRRKEGIKLGIVAGAALGILEKMNIKSKAARCIGMIAGILTTGVIGGSVIANYIGNNFINPIIFKDKETEKRTPELLDLSLHTDDIATV